MPPAAATVPPRLIVGLGNPGRDYEHTRHNVGFAVLDRLVARRGLAAWAFKSDWTTLWTRSADGSLLLKPQTFMNESGRAVAAVARFFKVPPGEILVVYDELALPLGRLRLRPDGSAGGHNGMQSVIERLGTPAIPRLRVGIGAARGGGAGMVGHVLGKFRPEERAEADLAVETASDAVDHAQLHGLDAAMNHFNRVGLEKP